MTTPHRLQALTATRGVYDSERAALRNEMRGFRSPRAAAARVRAVWQAPCLTPYRLRSQIARILRFIRRAVARAHELSSPFLFCCAQRPWPQIAPFVLLVSTPVPMGNDQTMKQALSSVCLTQAMDVEVFDKPISHWRHQARLGRYSTVLR